MYSYEDRVRAVELYIKLGKRLEHRKTGSLSGGRRPGIALCRDRRWPAEVVSVRTAAIHALSYVAPP